MEERVTFEREMQLLAETEPPSERESGKPAFKRVRRGYARSGGGRVDKGLRELRDSSALSIRDEDIDMLQRMANVETGGRIQAVNSWDSAFMSMGFMQLTVKYSDKYNPDGKLQRLIHRAPEAFRRHGIELDSPRRYRIKAGGGKFYRPLAIRGAQEPENLRSLEWAERFYSAGLDPDIIAEEAKLALEVIAEDKKRITDRVGSDFLSHYNKSAVLRALIHETFNNRPAHLYSALKRAIERATNRDKVSTNQFLELVRQAIREIYSEKEKDSQQGRKKAENLIRKTARLVL